MRTYNYVFLTKKGQTFFKTRQWLGLGFAAAFAAFNLSLPVAAGIKFYAFGEHFLLFSYKKMTFFAVIARALARSNPNIEFNLPFSRLFFACF
ncbi:MAG: hypothetical protein FWD66_07380 [Paludibacter sp.]|nr:hypothetical protein [Paludibacter sp.]